MKPEELAQAIKELTEWAHHHAPGPEPVIRQRLRDHLGGDPRELPVVSRPLAAWDRPNFQVAVDAWTEGREVEVVGLPVMQGYRAGLAELVRAGDWMPQLELGAVEHGRPCASATSTAVACSSSARTTSTTTRRRR